MGLLVIDWLKVLDGLSGLDGLHELNWIIRFDELHRVERID